MARVGTLSPVCLSAAQDSISCSSALLMLGREIQTPAEMMVGKRPDAAVDPPCPICARKLQDRLESADESARDQLGMLGLNMRQTMMCAPEGSILKPSILSGSTTHRGRKEDARSWTMNGWDLAGSLRDSVKFCTGWLV